MCFWLIEIYLNKKVQLISKDEVSLSVYQYIRLWSLALFEDSRVIFAYFIKIMCI